MSKFTIEDIWIYLYERGEVRVRELKAQFVDTGKMARKTMYKYKKLLEAEGKLEARLVPNQRPPYNTYYVPKKFHHEAHTKRIELKEELKCPPDFNNQNILLTSSEILKSR